VGAKLLGERREPSIALHFTEMSGIAFSSRGEATLKINHTD
jgi:hypothetical protein